MSFPAKLISFASFLLFLFHFKGTAHGRAQHGNHGEDLREAILSCITGVSRQIARTGADGEIHIQHIAREKEQRRKIPPRIRQRLGDFPGLMVFFFTCNRTYTPHG